MSDELEGWRSLLFWDGVRKEILGQEFQVVKREEKFFLRIPGYTLATRTTLAECQHLAHATARLWAGEE